MAMKFTDNTRGQKIIAIDFDGCITRHNQFPKLGELRPYAKKVIDLLHKLGVKIVIWTCRDKGNGCDDQQSMIEFLDHHDIYYDKINSTIEYAPWQYEGRKVYAHMYVDDCGFGWRDTDTIFLDVMEAFMITHMRYEMNDTHTLRNMVELTSGTTDQFIDWINKNMRIGDK